MQKQHNVHNIVISIRKQIFLHRYVLQLVVSWVVCHHATMTNKSSFLDRLTD